MKRQLFTIILIVFIAFSVNAQFLIDEAFENITTLPGDDWNEQNLSEPIGTLSWFQGDTTVFPAYEGAGYLAVNYISCAGIGTISNWMLTPEIDIKNGDVFSFWTSTVSGSSYADRLQVRMSLNGSSTDVGATAVSVGDFENLLLDINETYSTNFPEVWTEYEITISGVTGTVPGRLAFRYFVENGGPLGSNSNYIGIDLCRYELESDGTAPITFIVDNTAIPSYTGFALKGSWDAGGNYDAAWGGGVEHSVFYDDGTNGDVTADDDIWTCMQYLIPDAGANTWEWGVNDQDGEWIDGNWQFTVIDDTPQELTYATVGVNSISAENISIYPNPSKGIFNVNVQDIFTLEVLDIMGKVLNTKVLTGNSSFEINTAGVYFFRFSNEEGSVTQRVIVQ